MCLAAFALLCVVVNLQAANRESPVIDAVKIGDHASLRALLAGSASVNVSEPDGTTALHWAVRAGDLEAVQLLLRAGANASASNRYGITPLFLAATNGDAPLIDTLVRSGANPNTATPQGETVLMTAARTGSPAALKVLLAAGADVNAKEHWLGESALMWAAAENHPEAVEILIKAGADVDEQSFVSHFPRPKTPLTVLPRGGWTALMYAARQGSEAVATILADAGANLDVVDPDGTTALMLAIVNAHFDLAARLVHAGADVNVADRTGTTALFAAVDMHTLPAVFGLPERRTADKLDSLDIVKLLLVYGADPNAQLRAAMLQRLHTPGDPIVSAGATAFMRAARGGDLVVMRLLLDSGVNPALALNDHTPAIMIASGLGWRAGDANLNTRDRGTEEDAIQAIKLCLEVGGDIRGVNDKGDGVLHAAAGRGNAVKIVRFLVANGADPNLRNLKGQTPLDVALARKGQDGATAVSADTVAALRELMASVAGSSPIALPPVGAHLDEKR